MIDELDAQTDAHLIAMVWVRAAAEAGVPVDDYIKSDPRRAQVYEDVVAPALAGRQPGAADQAAARQAARAQFVELCHEAGYPDAATAIAQDAQLAQVYERLR